MKKFLGLGLVCILCFAGIINAEIYNWQTGEVIPGTEDITPGPGVWLGEYWNTESKNLKYADFADKDMSGAMFEYGWLDYAIFTNSNLTNAIFFGSVITGADFTDAVIKGARFDRYYDDYDNVWNGTGITSEQLYSTKSYKDKDLSGISLGRNDLSGWNLTGQNLTESDFYSAMLNNTDLSGANLTRAGFGGANLTDADLGGANLTEAYFRDSILTGVDFTDAEIKGADLSYTTSNGFTSEQFYSTISYKNKDLQGISIRDNDLSGWNFEEQNLANAEFVSFGCDAILVGTNFQGANLTQSYFAGVNLTSADLSGANLAYADFTWAILIGANFADAEVMWTNFEAVTLRGFTSEQLYSTKSYKDKDLSGIQLVGNDLSGWNFEEQNLTGAIFSNLSSGYMTILSGTNFQGANLEDTFFEHATLSNADLSGANLTNAYFGKATIIDSYLSGANLVRADFHEATFTGTDFTDAEIKGANFNRYYDNYNDTWHGTGITNEQLYSTKSYKDKDLSGIMLGYHDLTGWNFQGQNLTNVDFDNSVIKDADFSKYYDGSNWHGTGMTETQLYSTKSYKDKDLSGVKFRGDDLTGWNFKGQNLTNADFSDAEVKEASFVTSNGFIGEQLYSTKSYKNKDLTGIKLAGNDLSGWNFEEQNLTGAGFGSWFSGEASILTGANFHGANLSGADFEEAVLANADFTDADIKGAFFRSVTSGGFTCEQLYSTKSYKDKDLSGIQLGGNDLSGWNLTGQNLTNVDFWLANLEATDFTDAEIRGAMFDRYYDENLPHETVITSQQLYSTKSYKNKDLSGVSLFYNDLSGWDFKGQNLTNASFRITTLAGADFTDAEIKGADFSYTTQNGFTEEQLYSTKSYKNKNLLGINLCNNDLSGWNFAGINLTNSELGSSNLTETDFSFADLRGAYYDGGAIMRNTIESDGKIKGLNLLNGDILEINNSHYMTYKFGWIISPISITVADVMTAEDGSTMRFLFDEQDWISTVAMTDGISVDLGGTLELTFADGVDIASLIGTSFKIFEWNGLLSEGDMFDNIVYANGTQWDVSKLYTTGEVVLTAVPEPMTIAMLGLGGLMIRRKIRV